MKNFDLEAAKRGAAVTTANRHVVDIMMFDSRCTYDGIPYPIVAEVRKHNGDIAIETFRANGMYSNIALHMDLMMRDDDYLEKLERGEYEHIADARKMVGPAIKQNLNTDRKYWLRVFAGQAMQGILASDVKHEYGLSRAVGVAAGFADALIAKMNEMDNYI